jgi:hypothetical protein
MLMAFETVGEKIDGLRGDLQSVTPPRGLRCKSFNDRRVCEIGFAFFPGGHGVLDGSRAEITTLVLGSDWGNEVSFDRIVSRTSYDKDEKSFGVGRRLLEDAGFCVEDCFFTNAWPVLRSDDMPEIGHHAMREVTSFTQQCRGFFKKTLKSLQPKVVITLGLSPAWFVTPLVENTAWLPDEQKPRNDCGVPVNFTLRSLPTEPVESPSKVLYVAGVHWSYLSKHASDRWNTKDARATECALYELARKTAGITAANEQC